MNHKNVGKDFQVVTDVAVKKPNVISGKDAAGHI